jgi:hypothetical protein
MKKCTYCGKEYADDATVCAVDEQPLERVGAPIASPSSTVAEPVTHSDDVAAIRAAANKNMLVGGLWCAGGILVTALTYSAASGGGSYVVAWGAIVFGGIQFFRGLLLRSRI